MYLTDNDRRWADELWTTGDGEQCLVCGAALSDEDGNTYCLDCAAMLRAEARAAYEQAQEEAAFMARLGALMAGAPLPTDDSDDEPPF